MVSSAVSKNKYLAAFLALAITVLGVTLPLTSSQAFTLDKQFYDLTVCRGQLEANTLFDLQVGLEEEEAVARNVQLYVSVWATRFWELLETKKIRGEDSPKYDSIHSQAFAAMMNSLNQETFDSEEYEQLLGCNTLVMKQMMKKRALFDDEAFKKMAVAIQDQVVGNYWIMMGLEYREMR